MVNLSAFPALVDDVGVMAIERQRDYAALYREVGPQLWRAILVYAGGRREVADDAVGEAFARAIESDGVIRRPFPWLYRTAFRIAAAELRREEAPLSPVEARFDDPATGEALTGALSLQTAALYRFRIASLTSESVASAPKRHPVRPRSRGGSGRRSILP
jgi:DNA-directed RNA polymerase specialized sigma24 family protein